MVERDAVRRAAGLVLAATVAVTIAFLGLFAFLVGDTGGFGGRFPYYVLAFTIAFTVVVVILERRMEEGDQIILTAAVLSLTAGVVFMLDVEGVRYAIANPEQIVASRLILYLVSAGFLCTGLVYWGVKHWREFVG
jgi:hypothetical protein